jgi:hypothetical protein
MAGFAHRLLRPRDAQAQSGQQVEDCRETGALQDDHAHRSHES